MSNFQSNKAPLRSGTDYLKRKWQINFLRSGLLFTSYFAVCLIKIRKTKDVHNHADNSFHLFL